MDPDGRDSRWAIQQAQARSSGRSIEQTTQCSGCAGAGSLFPGMGIVDAAKNIQAGNYTTAALDIASELPLGKVFKAGKVTNSIPDSTVICRGGSCTADAFTNGSGVVTDAISKNISGVSTGIGDSVAAASKNIPHGKVGVSTVGELRAAGAKLNNNHGNHVEVSGITAEKAAELFKNVVKNPNKGG